VLMLWLACCCARHCMFMECDLSASASSCRLPATAASLLFLCLCVPVVIILVNWWSAWHFCLVKAAWWLCSDHRMLQERNFPSGFSKEGPTCVVSNWSYSWSCCCCCYCWWYVIKWMQLLFVGSGAGLWCSDVALIPECKVFMTLVFMLDLAWMMVWALSTQSCYYLPYYDIFRQHMLPCCTILCIMHMHCIYIMYTWCVVCGTCVHCFSFSGFTVLFIWPFKCCSPPSRIDLS
jgi:hypothetical protein